MRIVVDDEDAVAHRGTWCGFGGHSQPMCSAVAGRGDDGDVEKPCRNRRRLRCVPLATATALGYTGGEARAGTMTTALITGASAGLGAHFALALAKQGRDLILVARREDRLEQLADLVRERYGVTAHVIAADLAKRNAVAKLAEAVAGQGLTVDTLVNNAGFGARGAFAELDRAAQARMIDVNCGALVELCHVFLPAMLERRSGAILNVASTAAFQPGPWMAVYYASKAFVLSFSEALHEEVKDQGVRVTALCPGPTRTEFADVAGAADSDLFRRLAGSPEKVVADGLKALQANRAVAVSGAANKTMAASIRLTPRGLARRIAGSLQKTRGT
jgi:short-subunit dehydrogenase